MISSDIRNLHPRDIRAREERRVEPVKPVADKPNVKDNKDKKDSYEPLHPVRANGSDSNYVARLLEANGHIGIYG